MKPRHAAALACAYFVGWALVLATVIVTSRGGSYSTPAFIVIQQHEGAFWSFVGEGWFLFSIPCLFVAVGLHREQKSKQKPPVSDHL